MKSNGSLILLLCVAALIFLGVGTLGWRLLAYNDGFDGAEASGAADGRRIQVIFQSHILGGLPVRFSPSEQVQYVTPGVEQRNTYLFQNLSDQTVYFTPIHSVAPADAARHFSMSICFCFYDQQMPPNSTAEFTVVYRLDPAMSKRTNPVIINYNLRRIDAGDFRRQPSEHGAESEILIRSSDASFHLQPMLPSGDLG